MAAALDQRGMGHYFRTHFLDKTFQGLYQVNAFDLALLIPYFIVLILLASYGIHRYVLVYLYYKHRKNKVSAPVGCFDELPRITVQLPIFNEQFVVDRLVDAVCRLDYPRRNSTSRCSTIPPTKPSPPRGRWWNATPRWGTTSPTITAPTAKASRRARCRRA